MKRVFAIFMANLNTKFWRKYLNPKFQTIVPVFCFDSITKFTIANLYNSVFSKCDFLGFFFFFFINALAHALFSKKTFGKTRVS